MLSLDTRDGFQTVPSSTHVPPTQTLFFSAQMFRGYDGHVMMGNRGSVKEKIIAELFIISYLNEKTKYSQSIFF